jgi:outer membrane protein assembly factor BamB
MLEKRLPAVILLVFFAVLTIVAIAPRVGSEEYSKSWPMFRHDLMHTGYSTSAAPSTNQTLWSYITGNQVHSSPSISSGVVYVGSDDYKLYALNATTGALIWSYSTGSAIESSPAFSSGMIYVGSGNKIFALNAMTGAYIWSYTTGYLVESSPAVADGTVYVGSNDYKVYALNAATGALIWSYTTGNFVDSSPAVSDGIVYVGSCDYKVYALNASTLPLNDSQRKIWSYPTGAPVESSPVVVSGVVYVGSDDYKLYALTATTGAHIWNFTTGNFVYSSPAIFNGTVYVGSNDYKVYALNATTGDKLWDFTTGGPVLSSPAVAGGVVFAGSTDYNIYGLDLTNGTAVWTFNNGYVVRSSPAVAGELLFVGSDDKKIYAIGRVPCTVSITPTSVIMDVGQSRLFTSAVTGGTLPYTYQWCFSNGTKVTGANSSSWTFTPNSSGPYGIYLNVTDAVNMTAKSNIATVTVNPALSVVVSPTSVVMDIGQSQLFAADVTGGTSPYTYQWYRNGTAIPGATNTSWTFTPNSAGFYNVYMNVTDGVSFTAKSNIANITVSPTLTINISPSSVVMDVGQSRSFNSTISGGTFPFTYQWYYENGTEVSGATDPNWTFTPSSPEAFSIYANVTDTASFTSKSNIAAVTVNPALSVVVSPTSAVIDVGQAQLFNSTVSNGTLPYTYRWYLNGIAVPGATSSTWTLAPNSTGNYNVYVNVTDGAGFTIISDSSTVTVNPALIVRISPGSAILDVGELQLFSSSMTGGTPTYSYQWYLNGANVSGANSDTWTFSSATAGSYTVYLKVTDNTAAQVTSNIASVSVGFWPMFHRDLTHTGYSNSSAPRTSQLGWSYATGGSVESSPAVLGDVVFVGSYDGRVYALGASNGTLLWSYATGGSVSSSPAVLGGVVFVGSLGSPYGRVYALNASTGSLLWNYTTIGGQVYSSPAGVSGMVFVGSGYRIYALNASTGTLIWSSATSALVWSSPAAADGIVFVGSTDKNVYALNASTGALIWSYATGGAVYSSPAVVGDVVYVGSYDKRVYALNATNGSFLWSYLTGDLVHSSPAVANGTVFVGSNDFKVYALNASTGSLLWNYITGGQVYSSPAAVGGIVFFGSYDYRFYALNASTGALVWSYTTSAAVISSPAVANGTVFVGSQDHNVYAFGQLPLSVTISPTSVVMDVTQSRQFTSSVTGGTSPYTYRWYRNGTAVGTNSSTYTFYTSSPGSYTIYVNVTDGSDSSVKSNIATITANVLPGVAISPTSAIFDVGQSQLFTSTVYGGTPPYSYQWYYYLSGFPVSSGVNTTTWTFTPTSTGTYYVYLNVTDSVGYEARSNIASVTVNRALSISVTPSTAIIDIGQSRLFTSSVTGGTSPFAYQWYLNGTAVSGATGSSWTFTPGSTGPYTVYLNVTDNVGFIAKSNVATVTVNQTPTVTISPTSAVMDVGQSKQFFSSISGGTLPFAYQWYLNGTAASGATNPTWSFAPNSSGLYNVHVNVTDGAGFTAKSNTATVTVNPALSVAVSPSSAVLDVGQSQLFSSSVTGGTSPYSYQWYLNGTLVTGATSSTWTFTPASAGFNSVSMRVNDTAGAQAISNTATVTVNIVPTVGISPSATVIDIGQSQLFTSNVTGGTLPLAYQWYLNGTAVTGATGSSWTFTPGSTGPYTVYLNVTDNVGIRAKSNTASIAVNPAPFVSISPASAVLDVGQSRQFNSTLSGGSSPYYYQWYLNNAPVTGATNPTWTFTPTSTGSFTVYLNFTDGVGVMAKSNIATIAVNPAPSISVLPASAIMNMGQSRQFNSTVMGGTSPFAYQWYLDGTAVAGATNSAWTFVPSSSSSYSIYVNVTDTVGFTAKSNTVSVTVNSALSVSVSPMTALLIVGQSQLFTATVSGGTPSYSYQWYRNGTLVSGATGAAWNFTTGSVGTYQVYVRVTDGVNVVAQSPNAQVTTVNPAPTVSVSPNSAVMDMGQSRQLNSTVTGGNPSFAYQWYLNGTPAIGATNSTWTFVPSSSGFYSIYVNVTDAVGFTAKSNTATVTVNPALSVSVSPMTATLFVGQSQLFTPTVSGGTPSFAYQWYRNGTLVSGATSSTWTFTTGSAGTYEIYVKVTDGVNAVAQSPNAQVAVNPIPQPGVLISPGSAAIDVGQSVFFTSSQTGGTPPYTSQWYLNGSAVPGATSSSWNFTPTSTGTYHVYLNVTDSLNVKVQSNTAIVTTNPVPTVSISPTTAVIEVAQPQLFTSTVSGGTIPHSYQWYLNETLVSGATSSSWTFTPATAGQYTVYVKMTDAVLMQATSNSATVTVNVPMHIHNVAITNVTPYKTIVSQNYSLNITVTATNLGEYPETFNVTVYANTTIVETRTVNNLLNGTSTVPSFVWNTTGFAKGNYTISAYAQPVSGETNTQDNNLTSATAIMLVGMPGDLMPQFGVVDMKDIAYVAKHFATDPSNAHWDPNADINGDGKVDMKDIALVAKYFGKRDL